MSKWGKKGGGPGVGRGGGESKAAFVAKVSEALEESPDKKRSCTIFCSRAPSSHSGRFNSFANSRHNPAKGQEKINELRILNALGFT